MTAIHRSAIVPYTAQKMYELVADIPAYPEFLPWCSGARVLSQTEDSVVASIDIAYSGVRKTVTTRNLLQPGKMMEMRMVDGPFSHLSGFWHFTVLDENGSRISLDMDFQVANRLVGLMLTPAFTTVANQLVDSFHARARALYGRAGGS